VSKIIWQKAASPTCPLAAANRFVRSWLPSNTWFPGPIRVSLQRHLDRFSSFCTVHPRHRHRDTQWRLRMRGRLKTKPLKYRTRLSVYRPFSKQIWVNQSFSRFSYSAITINLSTETKMTSLDVAPTNLATFPPMTLNYDLWPWQSNLTQTWSTCTSVLNIISFENYRPDRRKYSTKDWSLRNRQSVNCCKRIIHRRMLLRFGVASLFCEIRLKELNRSWAQILLGAQAA